MLPIEFVKSALTYNPLTGVFLWRHRADMSVQWNGRFAGKEAGCIGAAGYRLICLSFPKKRLYRAHQLAWLFVYGEWPRDDNRIHNLRTASHTQNGGNSRKPITNNSGFKGVSRSGRKSKPWAAHIKYYQKSRFLGRYKTREEAHAAYIAKAKELFGEFARAA